MGEATSLALTVLHYKQNGRLFVSVDFVEFDAAGE
jgi:hypothetical protein